MKGLLAAMMMFTRLPLWHWVSVDKRYFEEAIRYWPVIGFLTGFVTAGTFWLASFVLPVGIACVLAIIARVLLTGALHEDGLADFFDGFGGGTTKEKILAIMKDSHIGCYGTIGLLLYFLLYYSLLFAIGGSGVETSVLFAIILSADCFSKFCAAGMINTLSYVRKVEESKVHLLYNKVKLFLFAGVGFLVLIPFLFLDAYLWCAVFPALMMACGLRFFLKLKIGGYTGDCCGASVLLIEQVFYITIVALLFVC
ncbi:adenosylcobinamide-GDP ribazoletransferase [Sanguibacteroides justesenii]|uniref:adenosylcobinamide-GDP ribazoletransferase n=1 Tax=Porphyromonadaceae TaxID=171551 RepID=UPI00073E5A47|nr:MULTISPECIES: adenosylcobinamide-GDP ribazoletransferase [Porphyromonadaceae]PXZ44807.1 adenosylcobinamide-GDP ribazoletransferase [Sanguibacteroides justesenii]